MSSVAQFYPGTNEHLWGDGWGLAKYGGLCYHIRHADKAKKGGRYQKLCNTRH